VSRSLKQSSSRSLSSALSVVVEVSRRRSVAAADPRVVLGESAAVFDRIDRRDSERLAGTVLGAARVFARAGRSGLAAAAFAGVWGISGRTHVVGEATAPAVGPEDLVVALSRSGARRITLHQAQRARRRWAGCGDVRGRAGTADARAASVAVVVPVHDVQTRQHAGSLFEGAALILLDALCWRPRTTLG